MGFLPAAALIVMLAIIQGGQNGNAPPVMSSVLRSHLRTETLSPIATVTALPAAVRNALQDLFKDKTLILADPGAPFQATDVVMGTPLPWRRMIAAGSSKDHCVIYYERGGIAHVYTIVVFKLDGAKAHFEFGGAAQGGLAGIDAVKAALASGSVLGYNSYF